MKLVVGQLLGQSSQAMAFLVYFTVGRVRAPVDSDLAQELETDIYAPFGLRPHRVQISPKLGHLSTGRNVRGNSATARATALPLRRGVRPGIRTRRAAKRPRRQSGCSADALHPRAVGAQP